jgi:hypothetical protein
VLRARASTRVGAVVRGDSHAQPCCDSPVLVRALWVIHQALGADTIKDLAAKFGLSSDELAKTLSSVLPQAVDHLTPGGTVPKSC